MQGAWRAARPADVTFAPVVAGLVDLAARRPQALLAGNPAVVVGLVLDVLLLRLPLIATLARRGRR
jgi:hypothetical protein